MTITAMIAQGAPGEVFEASEPVQVVYQGTTYLIGDVPAGVMLETLALATASPGKSARTELQFLAAAVTHEGRPVEQTWLKTVPWRVFSRWLLIAQRINGLDQDAAAIEKKGS